MAHRYGKVLWWLLAAALVSLALQLPLGPDSTPPTDGRGYCVADSDCAPASCCHPGSCTGKNYKPDCRGVFCTEVCSGPLDCGAGSCACVKNQCQVVSK